MHFIKDEISISKKSQRDEISVAFIIEKEIESQRDDIYFLTKNSICPPSGTMLFRNV